MQRIHNSNRALSSIKDVEKAEYSYKQEWTWKLVSHHMPILTQNKWIKDLNITHKTKILVVNTRKNVFGGLG